MSMGFAKMAELIERPFGMWLRGGPWIQVLGGSMNTLCTGGTHHSPSQKRKWQEQVLENF